MVLFAYGLKALLEFGFSLISMRAQRLHETPALRSQFASRVPALIPAKSRLILRTSAHIDLHLFLNIVYLFPLISSAAAPLTACTQTSHGSLLA
jgi:hypothetical protein